MIEPRDAVTQPIDDVYDALKSSIRPGFFGELVLRIFVQNGKIGHAKTEVLTAHKLNGIDDKNPFA